MKNLPMNENLAKKCVNTIKLLAVEGVQKANSGHPGMPMGAVDIAFVLWSRFLKFNPQSPAWPNRDRFVLSAGHGSMLLYTMLHLSGYDISLEDLKNFRQWGSKTPGHPEFGCAPGVETTTGPLGQGFATGVGMAIAEKMMQSRFNSDKFKLYDHKIYAIVGDGDLMEGVSSEAASLAGHLKLGNLIYFYDDNHITIEGTTEIAFSENVAQRFQAYGWQTLAIDGHDHEAIARAIGEAQAETEKPSLILARTHIAHGSPNLHDSHHAHGAPLGEEEIKLFKESIGWPEKTPFHVPAEVREFFAGLAEQNIENYKNWLALSQKWQQAEPAAARRWQEMLENKLPVDLAKELVAAASVDAQATRQHSGNTIQKVAELLPGVVGGSADLAPSNNTPIKNSAFISATDFSGRNFHFGVREHGMGAVVNGLALYGGFIPYCATFLVFSDYMRGAIRLSALMHQRVIFVFTHDSIFLGEDGPTHQPIEQQAALQVIPNMTVIRPADGLETAAAWAFGLKNAAGPTALILTRQKLPTIHSKEKFDPTQIEKGGFVISDVAHPELVLVASGSEVHVALGAKDLLAAQGKAVRVVSMPSLKLFRKQPQVYQKSVVPDGCPVVAIDAGVPDLWYAITGTDGLVLGIERFGASAPAKVLAEKFGFTPAAIAAEVTRWLNHGDA
jgi:transketolase